MDVLNTKIDTIQSDVSELKTDVKAALALSDKVNSHDKFIVGLKRAGVVALVLLSALALAAITQSPISITRLIKP